MQTAKKVTEYVSVENISITTDLINITSSTSVEKIVEKIRESPCQSLINSIRSYYQSGKKDDAGPLKKKLPAFTACGTFKKTRKLSNHEIYSHYILLDADKLEPNKIDGLKKKISAIPYSIMAFVSPSGRGLKIMVMVDSKIDIHKIAYNQVKDYYSRHLDIEFDPKTNDISRLCFFSHDPDIYYNPSADIFPVILNAEKNETNNAAECEWSTERSLFEKAKAYTEKKERFLEGNRNNFVYLLSCNCNRFGIHQDDVISCVFDHYGTELAHDEIERTIASVYRNNNHEFGKWNNEHSSNTLIKIGNEQSNVLHKKQDNPPLPDNLISVLPSEVRKVAECLSGNRERDVFLTGFLTILSGCLYNVVGVYDGAEVTPALFSFIVAPAASGKGSLRLAREIFNELNKRLKAKSDAEMLEYQILMEEYEDSVRAGKKGLVPPEKPPYKALFIPGNSSSAAVYDHLNDCDGIGVFCETEADALGQTLGQDWAGFSHVLRAAFHHETASVKRKGQKAIEIEKPCLAVALSGTPSQIPNILPSAEDGLFSRFIYYNFEILAEWRDVSPNNGKGKLPALKTQASLYVANMIEQINKQQINIALSQEQWKKLNNRFEKILMEVTCFNNCEFSSSVKRLGLIAFRIAMLLTSIRSYQNNIEAIDVCCEDEDLDLALSLSTTFLSHAESMYKTLPQNAPMQDSKLKKFYEVLPTSFDRKSAIEFTRSADISISDRTVDGYLARLVEKKLLIKDQHNKYSKNGLGVQLPTHYEKEPLIRLAS